MHKALTLEKRIEAELKSYDGKMSIYADIAALIAYAEERDLVSPLDRTYTRNRLDQLL